MKVRAGDAAALGLALLLAGLAYRFVLGLELVGWDSYPSVAACRAASPAELLARLSEPWLGGRYPRGDFYRPLSVLSFAADYALWGTAPRGYQQTNLAVLLLAVAAVFGLARHWLGSAFGAGVAALVFALHASLLEVVPVAARRSELLALAFTAAALWAQPTGARAAAGRLVLGAVLALLAAGAKESGFAVMPAIVALHASRAPRLRDALWRSLPAAVALAGLLALRTAVLAGLGGHPDSWLASGGLRHALQESLAWLRAVLMPQPLTESALDGAMAAGLGLALCVASGVAAARSRAFAGLLPVLGAWAGALLLLTLLSGDPASWYVAPLVAPYALLLGAAAAFARHGGERRAALGVGCVCGLAVLTLAATSPLLRSYPAWPRVSRESADFLGEFRAALASAKPGAPLVLRGLPLGIGAPLERRGVRSALGLSDYSLEAYAELHAPERPVRVRLDDTPATPLPPGTLDVIVHPTSEDVTPLLRGASR